MLLSTAAALALFVTSPVNPSTPKEGSGFELPDLVERERLTPDALALRPVTVDVASATDLHTFALTMPPEVDTTDLNEEITEKTKQLATASLLTTAVGALTLYYACVTDPSTWLSTTMGSYCTNTILTGITGSAFLYRDRQQKIRQRNRRRQS